MFSEKHVIIQLRIFVLERAESVVGEITYEVQEVTYTKNRLGNLDSIFSPIYGMAKLLPLLVDRFAGFIAFVR